VLVHHSDFDSGRILTVTDTRPGPVVGAYIGYKKDVSWRWAEWVVLILDGVAILLILLCQPESFGPRILHYKSKHFRQITGNEHFKTAIEASHPSMGAILSKCFVRPFLLCTEPIVMAFTFYLAIVYIILFTFLDGYVLHSDMWIYY
jgi:hypothetical protein